MAKRVPTRSSRSGGTPLLKADELRAWAGWELPCWQPFMWAWLRRGLRKPPTDRQRALLYPIADARPASLGRWVTEAPREGTAGDVIAHILGRWDAIVRASLDDDEEYRRARREVLDNRNDGSPESLAGILRRLGSA